MIEELKAGKTYVFVSEQAKQKYLSIGHNQWIYDNYYNDGFTLDFVTTGIGAGKIGPEYVISATELEFFKLKEDEPKKMKPEDKVTIEIPLRELAAIYAAFNNMNGMGIHKIYKIARDILDPDMSKIIQFEYSINKVFGEHIDYYSIQKDWEELLFGPQETEQQKKVRELREKAQALLDEADALEKE